MSEFPIQTQVRPLLAVAIVCLITMHWSCAQPPAKDYTLPEFRKRIEYVEKWRVRRPLRFRLISDSQNPKMKEPQNERQRTAIFRHLSQALTANEVEMVFHTGDFVKTGGNADEWDEYFDSLFWNDLSESARKRFFPAIGNHEYKPQFLGFLSSGEGNLKRYFKRFPHIRNYRNYYFTLGDACFAVMDSGENGIAKIFGEKWEANFDEQVEWLQRVVFREIASPGSGIRKLFVFYHKTGFPTPVFERNSDSAKILAMLESFNVENDGRFTIAVFSGHIHTFAHMQLDFNDDGVRDVHQFTCGCGGGPPHGRKYYKKVKRDEDLDSYRQAKYRTLSESMSKSAAFDSVRFDERIFGYLDVAVADTVTVEFHRFDAASGEFDLDYQVVLR